MDKSSDCETPKSRSEQNILKQNIRSKSIHNSTNVKRKDNKKLLRHKSVEERSLGLYANTFSSFPSFKTPPPVQKKTVNNPFNVGLRERLECSTFSPNVFSTVLSPSEISDEMRWTIEDLSSMKPAPIEENVEPLSEPDDPQVQEAIDKYFLETHMVPSPFDAPKNWVSRGSVKTPLLPKLTNHAVASTPRGDLCGSVRTRDVFVQTCLSLPPILPEHVEAVLRPFFNTNCETEESDFDISVLRRKLFFHQSDEQLSPVKCNNSEAIQKIEKFTPADASQGRHFTPIAGSSLEIPDISPVLMERSSINVSKSRAKLEFSDNSDNSLNKELSYDKEKNVDIVIDANSLIDEPMMVSVINLTNPRRTKKQKSSSEDYVTKPVTSTMCFDKGSTSTGNPSLEDMGYFTNEDMSWRQSIPITSDKVVNSLPIAFLAASTPTKEHVNEIF